MPASFDMFEHFKSRGLAARRHGDYGAARVYLLQAAGAMTELAEGAAGELRAERRRIAMRLVELARDCESASRPSPGPSRRPSRARGPASATDRGEAEEPSADDWILRDKPEITFEDVAGLEDAKAEIRLRMIYPAANPELAKRFGIRPGGGVLLYGPPGCGKTMMARAVAGELSATFFTVSPAHILSKWVGQAEQNVQKLFAAARGEPSAVIFIDEIEALVPRRAEQQSAVMTRVVPQILSELEGVRGRPDNPLLFLAATNEPQALDPAVLRPGRFDEKVYIPLPDALARYKMLEVHLGERPLADEVDLGELCDRLDGYSGADIRRICERAAAVPFLEAVNGRPERAISTADIERALAESKPSVLPAHLAKYGTFGAEGT